MCVTFQQLLFKNEAELNPVDSTSLMSWNFTQSLNYVMDLAWPFLVAGNMPTLGMVTFLSWQTYHKYNDKV